MASIHQRVHRSENIQIFRRKSKSFFPLRKIPSGRPLKKRTRRNRMKGPPWRQHPPPQHTTDTRCSFATFSRDNETKGSCASPPPSYAPLALSFAPFSPLFVYVLFSLFLFSCFYFSYSLCLFVIHEACLNCLPHVLPPIFAFPFSVSSVLYFYLAFILCNVCLSYLLLVLAAFDVC